jgi:hypothetical protein
VTEADWHDDRPDRLWRYLLGQTSRRKLRLFARACCRIVWDDLTEPFLRDAVVLGERFTDGLATPDEFRHGQTAFDTARHRFWQAKQQPRWPNYDRKAEAPWSAVRRDGGEPHHIANAGWAAQNAGLSPGETCGLIREFFGNPFRPVVFDPAWQTANVLALAQTAYDDRTFDRLPILADALEDAGCHARLLLDYLRSDKPHLRGCWALDLALGRPDAVLPPVADAGAWARCGDVPRMLAAGRVESRLLRLFAAECLREALPTLPDPRTRALVGPLITALIRCADEPAGNTLPWREVRGVLSPDALAVWLGVADYSPPAQAAAAAEAAASWFGDESRGHDFYEGCEDDAFAAEEEARARQADLLRRLAGNPFANT